MTTLSSRKCERTGKNMPPLTDMIFDALLPHSESGKHNQNALCLIPVQNVCPKRQEANKRIQPIAKSAARCSLCFLRRLMLVVMCWRPNESDGIT